VSFGIDGVPLKWYRSYVLGRTQYVRCGVTSSLVVHLLCRVLRALCSRPSYLFCTPPTWFQLLPDSVCCHTSTLTTHRFLALVHQPMLMLSQRTSASVSVLLQTGWTPTVYITTRPSFYGAQPVVTSIIYQPQVQRSALHTSCLRQPLLTLESSSTRACR